VNQNADIEIDDDEIHSGTGPCCWFRKSATIVDIISSTEASESLVCATCPELMMGTK